MDFYNVCEYCEDIIHNNEAWVSIRERFFHTQCLIEDNKDRPLEQLVDTLGITDSNEAI